MAEAWADEMPPSLVRIAQRCLEEPVDEGYGDTPIDVLYDVLGEPTPHEDALYHARAALEKLCRVGSKRAYEAVERLIGGRATYDIVVTEALAEQGLDIEMVDGRFWRRDEVSEELDVVEAAAQVQAKLVGKWAPAKAQWEASQRALIERRWPAAVADAANALEGVVKVASGKKNINDGTRSLFTAERSSLGQAMNQLHNYASAIPGARHGAARTSTLTETEARAVHQAAGVLLAMIINLVDRGELGAT